MSVHSCTLGLCTAAFCPAIVTRPPTNDELRRGSRCVRESQPWSKADFVRDLLRSIDVSVPSKGSQVPGELLEIILANLRPMRKSRPFDPELGQCSLTCRHWATHIRPLIFSRIELSSEKRLRAFSALVCSSVIVPAPLRETVHHLKIRMDKIRAPPKIRQL